jgi:hypothetical protein
MIHPPYPFFPHYPRADHLNTFFSAKGTFYIKTIPSNHIKPASKSFMPKWPKLPQLGAKLPQLGAKLPLLWQILPQLGANLPQRSAKLSHLSANLPLRSGLLVLLCQVLPLWSASEVIRIICLCKNSLHTCNKTKEVYYFFHQ